jgi:hypothetical protein
VADRTFGANISMVATNDAGYRGQADAGALEVLVAMQALEGDEEFSGVLLVKSGAIVADEIGLLLEAPAEVDMRLGDFAGEFGSVAEHILEDDAEQLCVTLCLQIRLDGKAQAAAGTGLLYVFGDIGGERGKVYRLGRELGASDP